MAGKFQPTTKDIGLLAQLHDDDQLTLKPEFQRNSVWPRAARAYLIDTILEGFPVPLLYFQKSVSAQTRRLTYSVIDGQQRLSSVFAFMNNKFMLTESDPSRPWYRKKWRNLDTEFQDKILSYDFTVLEISGYNDDDIRNMFQRINRYVVSLNPQELRHSGEPGAFKTLVEHLGSDPFWVKNRVISPGGADRMRGDELAAELLILLHEGPQDKKTSVDLYYEAYTETFPPGEDLTRTLREILETIEHALPNLRDLKHLRKPASFYSLVGAVAELKDQELLPDPEEIGRNLMDFDYTLTLPEDAQTAQSSQYLAAASRQTDNVRPRERRIHILKNVILGED